MSYLIRTGTGRNDIEFGGKPHIEADYLRKYGNNREDIKFEHMSDETTPNLVYLMLKRIGTGRNDIDWVNGNLFPAQTYDSYIREMFDPLVENKCYILCKTKNDDGSFKYTICPFDDNQHSINAVYWYGVDASLSLGPVETIDDVFGTYDNGEMNIIHSNANVIISLYNHFRNYSVSSGVTDKSIKMYCRNDTEYGHNNGNTFGTKQVYIYSLRYTSSNSAISYTGVKYNSLKLTLSLNPSQLIKTIYVDKYFGIYKE